ncbi:MAG TPA: glycosyltransferase family 4 protein [Steroidobacteraceae bacterium]|nr:glycosyltransferase family 4 protein [Steroidobacteraceae bacterium]
MPSLIWVNQFALLPQDGGGTRHFELGRELARKGWKVTILACDFHLHARKFTRRVDANDRSPREETLDGVTIRWLWAAPYEGNDWRRAWNWATFYLSVRREIRLMAASPDVVIGSSPQIFAAVAGRALSRKAGAKFVFEVRDLWPESLLAVGGRRGMAYYVIDRVANSMYRSADRILVLARGTREYLIAKGVPESKLVQVPNGVDVAAIRPNELTGEARREEHPITFIYAGAHGPANGLDAVLDAAEILGGACNARFKLVGDGPAKSALRADAVRRGLVNVEFLDSVSKPELARLLNGADAGLMLLREAPLFAFGVSPNKLFDYMAAALPIVCNVSGEVAAMLAESKAGLQTADTSGAALAASCREMVAMSAARRADIGLSGRSWVEREHSREVLGDRMDAFLRELLR